MREVSLLVAGALIGMGSTFLIGELLDYLRELGFRRILNRSLIGENCELNDKLNTLYAELDQHKFEVYKYKGKIQIRKKRGLDLTKKVTKK